MIEAFLATLACAVGFSWQHRYHSRHAEFISASPGKNFKQENLKQVQIDAKNYSKYKSATQQAMP